MSEEEEWENLPVETRWTHDKFKARKSAYDEVATNIEKGNISRLPIVDDLKSAACDSNMIALESGLKVIQATLVALNDSQLKQASAIGDAVTEPLASKGLNASKPAVRKLSQEIILVLVAKGDPGAVVGALLKALESTKVPKVVAAVLQAIESIFKEFGSPVTDPKPVLKVLPAAFSNTDRNVRTAASSLATSLCRWVGEPVMLASLTEIKPVQINELKQSFSSIDRSIRPSRLTRHQELQIEAAEGNAQADNNMGEAKGTGAGAGTANQPQEQDIDPWEYAEPQNVLDKINAEFWDLVKSPKWKEREEALKGVVTMLEKSLRMQSNGNYHQLVTLLLGIARNDATHMCSSLAIQGITALASGLRKGFNSNAKTAIENIYERFKDKKQIEVITKCFDTLFFQVLENQYTPILDVVWELGPKHKTALVRLESTKYCVHLLCESSALLKLSDYERLTDQSVKLLGDSQEPMRAAAANLLAALSKIVGEPRMNKSLSTLDDHKRKRVSDSVATISVKPRPKHNSGSTASPPSAFGATGSSRPSNPSRVAGDANQPTSSNGTRRPLQPPRTANNITQPGLGKVPPSMPAPRAPRPGGSILQPSQLLSRKPTPTINDTPMDISIDNSMLEESFESRESRPSISSTPKIIKRSVAKAEFTPARGQDTYRRRIISPTKPEGGLQSKSVNDLREKLVKLSAEIELEKSLRTEAENRLAKVQVEKDHQILRLKEELSVANLQLRTQKSEMESYMKTMERCWLRGSSSGDEVGSRLSEMSLNSDKPQGPVNNTAPGHPNSQAGTNNQPAAISQNANQVAYQNNNQNSKPSSGLGSRLSFGRPLRSSDFNDIDSSPNRPSDRQQHASRVVPLNFQSHQSQKPSPSYLATTGQQDLDRAVVMTQNLKQRVEQLKRQKQRSNP